MIILNGDRQVLVSVIILSLASLTGFIGLITCLALLDAGTISSPRIVAPLTTDVWMAALVLFYASVSLLFLVNRDTNEWFLFFFNGSRQCSVIFWRYHYLGLALVSFLLQLGWFVGYRIDGGAWGLGLFFLFIICYLVESRIVSTSQRTHESRDSSSVNSLHITSKSSSTVIAIEGSANSKYSGGESSSTHPGIEKSKFSTRIICIGKWSLFVLRIFTALFTVLLLGGCWLQAAGYRNFPPQGQYITINNAGGIKGYSQRILTQCVGQRDPSVPTIWVEVGGGGHSMSDLWGLRDYITTNYNRRYCSYDPPGTDWSDNAVSTQIAGADLLTAQVIAAMEEPGPFICLGSMDNGDVRCLKYCLSYPANCTAIVPVGFGQLPEFQAILQYYDMSLKDATAMAKMTLASRISFGQAINFFAVSWGLISLFIPNGAYQPANLAYESHFLNLFNERQWSTNNNFNYQASQNPQALGVIGPSYWTSDAAMQLPQSIPIFGFLLGQTASQLNSQCGAYGYAIGSKDCEFLFWQYNSTLTTDIQVIARNPASKLFICGDNCTTANGNGFVINQEAMIPWFAQTLWSAIANIKF